MKKRISSIWLTLVVSLVIVAPASATIITVEVEGVVDSVWADNGLTLDGSVIVGTTMTGFCIYDLQTPDLELSEYNGQYALLSISMNIGNYTFIDDPASATPADYPSFGVYTGDPGYRAFSPLSRFDGTVYIDGMPQIYEDIDWSLRWFELMDLGTNSDEYIPTDALPDLDSWPDLSIFDVSREFEARFSEESSNRYFEIYGEITSLTPTPEPCTLLLLGLGGLALLRRRKG